MQRYRPRDQDTGHDDVPDDDELTADTEGNLGPPGGRWIISLEAGLVSLAIIVLVAMIVIAAAE
ncbi:MAG: hypothetical protein M3R02_24725 [Chloroflexota bacterium]|nr:hypothetical protein [Chloroflexota bacterium]